MNGVLTLLAAIAGGLVGLVLIGLKARLVRRFAAPRHPGPTSSETSRA